MKFKLSLIALSLGLAATSAFATDVTETMDVTSSIPTVCTLAAGATLAFNTPYTGASNVDADTGSTISANCISPTSYTLAADQGAGAGATASARKVTLDGGSATLNYRLHRSAAGRSADNDLWGDGTGTSLISDAIQGDGGPQIYTVYGRIVSDQSLTGHAPGNYLDTVNLTLTY